MVKMTGGDAPLSLRKGKITPTSSSRSTPPSPARITPPPPERVTPPYYPRTPSGTPPLEHERKDIYSEPNEVTAYGKSKRFRRLHFGEILSHHRSKKEMPEESEYEIKAPMIRHSAHSFSSLSSLFHFRRKDDAFFGLNCCDRVFLRHISPIKSFIYECQEINEYVHAVDNEWKQILDLFDWPKLPGGQHKKARGQNYITHSIWITAYAAGTTLPLTNDNKEEYYKDPFENLLMKAELLGFLLKDFIEPLNKLETSFEPFEEMSKLMGVGMFTPVGFGENISDIFVESLVPDKRRFRIVDYLKLKIFTRDVHDLEWQHFHEIEYQEQMLRIRRGLSSISSRFNTILDAMPSVLLMIRNATGTESKKLVSLFPHIVKMQKLLKEVFREPKITNEQERHLVEVFLHTQENIQFLVEQTIYGLIGIWEVVLMTRLAYTYVQSNPNSGNLMQPLDEVVKRRMTNPHDRMSEDVKYKWKYFYAVNCANTMRKAPVILDQHVEMAIHLEGFLNPDSQQQLPVSASGSRKSLSISEGSLGKGKLYFVPKPVRRKSRISNAID